MPPLPSYANVFSGKDIAIGRFQGQQCPFFCYTELAPVWLCSLQRIWPGHSSLHKDCLPDLTNIIIIMHRSTPYYQNGLTLLELTVVLLVLISLGGLMLPFVGGTGQYARCTSTETSMRAIRDAIVGSFDQPGYSEDMAGLPNDLRGLTSQNYCLENETLTSEVACTGGGNTWIEQPPFNPVTRRGWNGPYLSTSMLDAYHLNDILLQIPSDSGANDCVHIDPGYNQQDCARLISIGPDETLQTLLADADGGNREDDQLLYLFIPDPNPAPSCKEML